MPVGNSDRGVGLGAGEVMVFADLAYQHFDWWHDVLPDAFDINGNPENAEHYGLFKNKLLNLLCFLRSLIFFSPYLFRR